MGWGVDAGAFAKSMRTSKAKAVNLHINSPGGDVMAARNMVDSIKDARKKGKTVTAYIEGCAASAATFIAIACDKVVMSKGSFFMIHNAMGFAMGDADEMRQTADLLDRVTATIADDYVAKTGKSRATVEKWMNDETWFTAQEALDEGFIDEIAEDPAEKTQEDQATPAKQAKPKNMNEAVLAAFKNPPSQLREVKDQEDELLREKNERRLAMLELLGPR